MRKLETQLFACSYVTDVHFSGKLQQVGDVS